MPKRSLEVRYGPRSGAITGSSSDIAFLLRDATRGAQHQNAGANTQEEERKTAERCRVYDKLRADIRSQEDDRMYAAQERGW